MANQTSAVCIYIMYFKGDVVMTKKKSAVSYQEALSLRVGEFLRHEGFAPATTNGTEVKDLYDCDELGVLDTDQALEPTEHLFGLIKRPQRRKFMGVIWFRNGARDADRKKWVIEVFGREHVETMKQMAEDLASVFNVKISMRLVVDEAKEESFDSDYLY